MKKIALTQGKVALVDDEDYDRVRAHTWYFHAKTGYAMGYDTHGRGRKPIYMHRFILGAASGDYTDHKSKNKLDNRRTNIRLCTQTQNLFNGDMARRKSTSKFRGVSASRYQWRAQVSCKTIGYFNTEEGAARAYDAAVIAKAPAFAKPNFPEK